MSVIVYGEMRGEGKKGEKGAYLRFNAKDTFLALRKCVYCQSVGDRYGKPLREPLRLAIPQNYCTRTLALATLLLHNILCTYLLGNKIQQHLQQI